MQNQLQVMRTYGFPYFLLQRYFGDQATFLLTDLNSAPGLSFYLFIYSFIYLFIYSLMYLFIFLFMYVSIYFSSLSKMQNVIKEH